jgi:hypothetical protein
MAPSRTCCPWWVLLIAHMLLGACSFGPRGRATSPSYALQTDSVTNTCIRGTANCSALVGENAAAAMRTRLAEVGASTAGASTVVEYLKRSEVHPFQGRWQVFHQEAQIGREWRARAILPAAKT